MNNHKAIMLGEDIPNEPIQGEIITQKQQSKFIETEDIVEDYGKKMLFMTPLEREVAFNLAEGVRHNAIAELLGIDVRTVKIISRRPHVKSFVTEYVEETTAMLKAKREQYLAQIIEAKLDKIADMSEASDLDIATLLMMQDTMGREKEKAKLQAGNQNQVINVLQLIRKDD